MTEKPSPPGPLAPLESFLSARPSGPVEIHVHDAIRHKPVTPGRIADAVVDELSWQILGGGDGGGDAPAPRTSRVVIRSAHDGFSEIEVGGVHHHDVIRVALLAGRRWRVPVLLFRERPGVGGTPHYDTIFIQRVLPDPGRLRHRTHLVDTPERFEVSIRNVDRPGRIGRTVLRRDVVDEHFTVTLDARELVVDRVLRSGHERAEVPTSELIAVVVGAAAGSEKAISLITSTERVRVPLLSFEPDGWKMQKWIWARINQRLGV